MTQQEKPPSRPSAPIRVLHTPQNTASLISHTVRAAREYGIDARSLVIAPQAVQFTGGLKVIHVRGPRLFARVASRLIWFMRVIAESRSCDLIHWYYGASDLPLQLDIRLLKWLRRPGLVEWQGSDVRIPEIEAADNPYYAAARQAGYEYTAVESRSQSLQRQKLFASVGFACAGDRSLFPFFSKEIFPSAYYLPRRLLASDYLPPLATRPPPLASSPPRP